LLLPNFTIDSFETIHLSFKGIIVGDGVFAFLEWLKLKNDGPDYVHSHEFGHHLQYTLGVDKVGNGWSIGEETRRWEMMADVFGSYYLGHAKGGRMDNERLQDVYRAAFSLGDCEDDVGSHHGTPRQRACASNYGANLALKSYVDNDYITQPVVLRRMFDDHYQNILDLDDGLCEVIVDDNLSDEAVHEDTLESSFGSAPALSPAATPSNKYEPYGGYSQSKYEPFNYNTNGWDGSIPYEENSPIESSQLDKPPPLVRNGTYSGDEDWLGSTELWQRPRSKGNYLDARFAVITLFVFVLIL